MSEEEFILEDRVAKIRATVNMYGEENFYIAFSGGKDSCVLSELVDTALPGNQIPRVYSDTGIELNMVRDFCYKKQSEDARLHIIKPHVPIKPMLEREGYPFKSKNHARMVERYQRKGRVDSVESYLGNGRWGKMLQCPKMLKYQFTEEFTQRIHLSDHCCINMKEAPLERWAAENGRSIAIIGVMQAEGGRRRNAKCLAFNGDALKAFQPLSVVTKDWEEWFIKTRNIDICDIYNPPYNFVRTGCKGCPFALFLQNALDTLEKFFPEERKQCEIIWKPVYEEYRRLGYRLNKDCNDEYGLCA